ncbi:MAG TPA: DUF1549 domain-containing protein [Bryobacteraceae bacterium]
MKISWFFLAAGISLAADSTIILPAHIRLEGPEARHQLITEATVDGRQQDVSRTAKWSSSNPLVASVDGSGMVTPVSDGMATISAGAAHATVTVVHAKSAFTWNFRNDVIPVLTKAGCNQGACHGALAGKNGFKLTLRGYDPEVDYDTLTRQASGRRISLDDPPRSLMLLKPTMKIPHGGGLRLDPKSLEYRVVEEWIASGTPRPSDADPQITGLEVYPPNATLKSGAEQQLVVEARYSDGNVRDVTRWVKYSSSDEGVASVDDSGRVRMNGSGETAITLWYSSRVSYARLTVPYENKIAPETYSQFRRRNYIDDFVIAKLKALNIAPSKAADDATFLRRAYLDAVGILPTPAETQAFLSDSAPDKREKVVDALLAREEFVDYWAYKWSDLLMVSSKKLRPSATWDFYYWIRESVRQNKPWDKMVREIYTATGDTRENGQLNFWVLHKDPIDIAETTTLAFMGQRLTCARCHNHPLEKWTQKQYYEFANLFARVGLKNGGQDGDFVVFAKISGDINHPRLLKPLAPAPLDAASIPLNSMEDRRLALAQWLTSPKNKLFSRAIVNRVWANFMGRGLVDGVDDLRATNPASNEELFSALTDDFVKNGYDIRRLIRTIMTSEVYQLASDANATNAGDNKYYSKYIVKRLAAEVLLDAMSQVTGVSTKFPNYAAGTRAMQLPDTQIKNEFLTSFGRPPRLVCDAAERSSEPNVAQALHVINGDTLNQKLRDGSGYAAQAVKKAIPNSRAIEHLFLAAYGRPPQAGEKQKFEDLLWKAEGDTPDSRQKALEDLMWAMLTSKEFLFNY